MRQTYGYIRVSTREQNEARQLDALYKAGVEEKKIYMDKQSGKDLSLIHIFFNSYMEIYADNVLK